MPHVALLPALALTLSLTAPASLPRISIEADALLDEASDIHRPEATRGPFPYVIVTDSDLAPAFAELAGWKRSHGTRAILRTMESIRLGYPGEVDDAARVRAFLQDARTHWRTEWVLIGGDPEVVPIRLAYSRGPTDDFSPSDLYYACLDGSWNADGDDRFAEHGPMDDDQVDVVPDVRVGRAPVANAAEAAAFVAKTAEYLAGRAAGGPVLALASVLSFGLDLAEHAEPLAKRIEASGTHVAKLYQSFGDPRWAPPVHPLTRESVLDSLSAGYDLVITVLASAADRVAIQETSRPFVYLTVEDVLGLPNRHRPSHVWMLGAAWNAQHPLSIGEALIRSEGGAVSVVTSTRDAFLSSQFNALDGFVSAIYHDGVETIGEAFVAEVAGLTTPNGGPSDAFLGRLLLGDPQLPVGDGRSGQPGRRSVAAFATPDRRSVEPSTRVGAEFAVHPNPARDRATLTLRLPAGAGGSAVQVAIHDLGGRLIRTLTRDAPSPGVSSLAWDLRDEAGFPAPDGVYFARLRFGTTQVVRRLALVR